MNESKTIFEQFPFTPPSWAEKPWRVLGFGSEFYRNAVFFSTFQEGESVVKLWSFLPFFCVLAADRCILVSNPLKRGNLKNILGEKGDEMIIKTEQDLSCDDIEIIIRCAKINKRLDRLITLIQSFDTQIKCNEENTERYVNVSDILYIESVDKRTFVYLDKDVLRTDYRLYQLANSLADLGFVQISKSCILNINALVSIRRLINSRMEATLKNGEKLHITRKYLDNIKRALQRGTEI